MTEARPPFTFFSVRRNCYVYFGVTYILQKTIDKFVEFDYYFPKFQRWDFFIKEVPFLNLRSHTEEQQENRRRIL